MVYFLIALYVLGIGFGIYVVRRLNDHKESIHNLIKDVKRVDKLSGLNNTLIYNLRQDLEKEEDSREQVATENFRKIEELEKKVYLKSKELDSVLTQLLEKEGYYVDEIGDDEYKVKEEV